MNRALRTLLLLSLGAGRAAGAGTPTSAGVVTVEVTPGKPAAVFLPSVAFGATVDGYEHGDIDRIYTPSNLRAMRSAGFRPLSYRLRTELGVEVWHWNPEGTWSDAEHMQGYWTSSPTPGKPPPVTYGYHLPRRGNTIDQANNRGYSRLDDGDPSTFWKSNPYLDPHFTGDDGRQHPQWIVIDLGAKKPVNALRISWAAPYAREYRIEYWRGEDESYILNNPTGAWRLFPRGDIQDGHGGDVTLSLVDRPVQARFLRILLLTGSGTAPRGSADVRDRLGFAVAELYVGKRDARGRLLDYLRHGKGRQRQSVIWTSSTDPWHRAIDRDENVEQIGFERLLRTGLMSGLPLMVAVGLLYDTPENAANLIRSLKALHFPMAQIELGEEPDGQGVTPEHFAALYAQTAAAIRKVDTALHLGGPAFQSMTTAVPAWPDSRGRTGWMARFLEYLGRKNRRADFQFFSLEWYPFDDVCLPTAPQLAAAPELLARVMEQYAREGVPKNIPWLITEYGYSSFAGQAEVDLPGALLNAEAVAQFLTLGGAGAYFYGYEPNTLMKELAHCDTWGNLALFLSDDRRQNLRPLATYYGARLLTREWAQPVDRPHRLYRATSDIRNARRQPLVTAFAVHRPDGQWSVLLINKDPRRARPMRIRFRNGTTGKYMGFQGSVDLFRFSSEQYIWHPNGRNGYAAPRNPPEHRRAGRFRQIVLPPYSLCLVRGRVSSTPPALGARHSPHASPVPGGYPAEAR